uniref:Uncharacterized protein n=1 Tax=viral metagenome TaxID=1070528 RepID=A0A6H1ZNS4_9ZZZZ
MENNNNMEKHERLLKDKNIIIKYYHEHQNYGDSAYKKISKMYGVHYSTILKNLKSWGVVRKSGIKYLLRGMLIND